jgi:hypothetical protein
MTLVDEFGLPGGHETVTRWISLVHGVATNADLWTCLDDRLRLTLAQGWLLATIGHPDEDLAEDLAADDSDHELFDAMLSDLVVHWRAVYRALKEGSGLSDRTRLVGAGMELVVLTDPEHVGVIEADTAIPAHCFITRLEADTWLIAALARRLPVPGWPPREEVVLGLGIDG